MQVIPAQPRVCMGVGQCVGYVHALWRRMCAGTSTWHPCLTGPHCVSHDAKPTWQKQIMSAPVIFSSLSALQEPFKEPNTDENPHACMKCAWNIQICIQKIRHKSAHLTRIQTKNMCSATAEHTVFYWDLDKNRSIKCITIGFSQLRQLKCTAIVTVYKQIWPTSCKYDLLHHQAAAPSRALL